MRAISVLSRVTPLTVCILLVSDGVLSTCYPKCDLSHCCVNGRCENRLELGHTCNPTDIKNGHACPCQIGFVCLEAEGNDGYQCHAHGESISFSGKGRSCWPKCNLEHCCVNGICKSRLNEGEPCNPQDIHSGHACPCKIGFVCVEENNEFRCKNHLHLGSASGVAAAQVATIQPPSTTPKPTPQPAAAPLSPTTVSTTTTTTPSPIITTTRLSTTTTITPPNTSTTTTPPATTTTTTPKPNITPPSTSTTTPSFTTPLLNDTTTSNSPLSTPTSNTPQPFTPTGSEPLGSSHPNPKQPRSPRPRKPRSKNVT